MKRFVASLLVWWSLMSGLDTRAELAEVGGVIPPITAKDQHGTNYVFTNGTAYLLFALDMDSGKAANKKISEQGSGFLEKHGAVYFMDIHTMPGIARTFALPKMRKYPQRIVLIEKAESVGWVPIEKGSVTILKLTPEGRIEKINYWQPSVEPITNLFP